MDQISSLYVRMASGQQSQLHNSSAVVNFVDQLQSVIERSSAPRKNFLIDATTAHGDAVITEASAMKSGIGWITLQVTEGIKRGAHEWCIKIENQGETTDGSGLMLGLVPKSFSKYDSFISQGGGWCLSRAGKFYGHWRRQDSNVGTLTFATGDRVIFFLDYEASQLAVRVGDKCIVGELSNLNTEVFPAVSLHYRHQHVRFEYHVVHNRTTRHTDWMARGALPAAAAFLPLSPAQLRRIGLDSYVFSRVFVDRAAELKERRRGRQGSPTNTEGTSAGPSSAPGEAGLVADYGDDEEAELLAWYQQQQQQQGQCGGALPALLPGKLHYTSIEAAGARLSVLKSALAAVRRYTQASTPSRGQFLSQHVTAEYLRRRLYESLREARGGGGSGGIVSSSSSVGGAGSAYYDATLNCGAVIVIHMFVRAVSQQQQQVALPLVRSLAEYLLSLPLFALAESAGSSSSSMITGRSGGSFAGGGGVGAAALSTDILQLAVDNTVRTVETAMEADPHTLSDVTAALLELATLLALQRGLVGETLRACRLLLRYPQGRVSRQLIEWLRFNVSALRPRRAVPDMGRALKSVCEDAAEGLVPTGLDAKAGVVLAVGYGNGFLYVHTVESLSKWGVTSGRYVCVQETREPRELCVGAFRASVAATFTHVLLLTDRMQPEGVALVSYTITLEVQRVYRLEEMSPEWPREDCANPLLVSGPDDQVLLVYEAIAQSTSCPPSMDGITGAMRGGLSSGRLGGTSVASGAAAASVTTTAAGRGGVVSALSPSLGGVAAASRTARGGVPEVRVQGFSFPSFPQTLWTRTLTPPSPGDFSLTQCLALRRPCCVDLGSPEDLLQVPGGHVTIELWLTLLDKEDAVTLYQHGDKSTSGEVFMETARLEGAFCIRGGYRHDARGSCVVSAPLPPVAESRFFHICLVFDGRWRLFFEGEEVAGNRQGPHVSLESPKQRWTVGTNCTCFLSGLRVWTAGRAAREISRDYQRALTGDEPGLVCQLFFNESGGNVAFNYAALTRARHAVCLGAFSRVRCDNHPWRSYTGGSGSVVAPLRSALHDWKDLALSTCFSTGPQVTLVAHVGDAAPFALKGGRVMAFFDLQSGAAHSALFFLTNKSPAKGLIGCDAAGRLWELFEVDAATNSAEPSSSSALPSGGNEPGRRRDKTLSAATLPLEGSGDEDGLAGLGVQYLTTPPSTEQVLCAAGDCDSNSECRVICGLGSGNNNSGGGGGGFGDEMSSLFIMGRVPSAHRDAAFRATTPMQLSYSSLATWLLQLLSMYAEDDPTQSHRELFAPLSDDVCARTAVEIKATLQEHFRVVKGPGARRVVSLKAGDQSKAVLLTTLQVLLRFIRRVRAFGLHPSSVGLNVFSGGSGVPGGVTQEDLSTLVRELCSSTPRRRSAKSPPSSASGASVTMSEGAATNVISSGAATSKLAMAGAAKSVTITLVEPDGGNGGVSFFSSSASSISGETLLAILGDIINAAGDTLPTSLGRLARTILIEGIELFVPTVRSRAQLLRDVLRASASNASGVAPASSPLGDTATQSQKQQRQHQSSHHASSFRSSATAPSASHGSDSTTCSGNGVGERVPALEVLLDAVVGSFSSVLSAAPLLSLDDGDDGAEEAGDAAAHDKTINPLHGHRPEALKELRQTLDAVIDESLVQLRHQAALLSAGGRGVVSSSVESTRSTYNGSPMRTGGAATAAGTTVSGRQCRLLSSLADATSTLQLLLLSACKGVSVDQFQLQQQQQQQQGSALMTCKATLHNPIIREYYEVLFKAAKEALSIVVNTHYEGSLSSTTAAASDPSSPGLASSPPSQQQQQQRQQKPQQVEGGSAATACGTMATALFATTNSVNAGGIGGGGTSSPLVQLARCSFLSAPLHAAITAIPLLLTIEDAPWFLSQVELLLPLAESLRDRCHSANTSCAALVTATTAALALSTSATAVALAGSSPASPCHARTINAAATITGGTFTAVAAGGVLGADEEPACAALYDAIVFACAWVGVFMFQATSVSTTDGRANVEVMGRGTTSSRRGSAHDSRKAGDSAVSASAEMQHMCDSPFFANGVVPMEPSRWSSGGSSPRLQRLMSALQSRKDAWADALRRFDALGSRVTPELAEGLSLTAITCIYLSNTTGINCAAATDLDTLVVRTLRRIAPLRNHLLQKQRGKAGAEAIKALVQCCHILLSATCALEATTEDDALFSGPAMAAAARAEFSVGSAGAFLSLPTSPARCGVAPAAAAAAPTVASPTKESTAFPDSARARWHWALVQVRQQLLLRRADVISTTCLGLSHAIAFVSHAVTIATTTTAAPQPEADTANSDATAALSTALDDREKLASLRVQGLRQLLRLLRREPSAAESISLLLSASNRGNATAIEGWHYEDGIGGCSSATLQRLRACVCNVINVLRRHQKSAAEAAAQFRLSIKQYRDASTASNNNISETSHHHNSHPNNATSSSATPTTARRKSFSVMLPPLPLTWTPGSGIMGCGFAPVLCEVLDREWHPRELSFLHNIGAVQEVFSQCCSLFTAVKSASGDTGKWDGHDGEGEAALVDSNSGSKDMAKLVATPYLRAAGMRLREESSVERRHREEAAEFTARTATEVAGGSAGSGGSSGGMPSSIGMLLNNNNNSNGSTVAGGVPGDDSELDSSLLRTGREQGLRRTLECLKRLGLQCAEALCGQGHQNTRYRNGGSDRGLSCARVLACSCFLENLFTVVYDELRLCLSVLFALKVHQKLHPSTSSSFSPQAKISMKGTYARVMGQVRMLCSLVATVMGPLSFNSSGSKRSGEAPPSFGASLSHSCASLARLLCAYTHLYVEHSTNVTNSQPASGGGTILTKSGSVGGGLSDAVAGGTNSGFSGGVSLTNEDMRDASTCIRVALLLLQGCSPSIANVEFHRDTATATDGEARDHGSLSSGEEALFSLPSAYRDSSSTTLGFLVSLATRTLVVSGMSALTVHALSATQGLLQSLRWGSQLELVSARFADDLCAFGVDGPSTPPPPHSPLQDGTSQSESQAAPPRWLCALRVLAWASVLGGPVLHEPVAGMPARYCVEACNNVLREGILVDVVATTAAAAAAAAAASGRRGSSGGAHDNATGAAVVTATVAPLRIEEVRETEEPHGAAGSHGGSVYDALSQPPRVRLALANEEKQVSLNSVFMLDPVGAVPHLPAYDCLVEDFLSPFIHRCFIRLAGLQSTFLTSVEVASMVSLLALVAQVVRTRPSDCALLVESQALLCINRFAAVTVARSPLPSVYAFEFAAHTLGKTLTQLVASGSTPAVLSGNGRGSKVLGESAGLYGSSGELKARTASGAEFYAGGFSRTHPNNPQQRYSQHGGGLGGGSGGGALPSLRGTVTSIPANNNNNISSNATSASTNTAPIVSHSTGAFSPYTALLTEGQYTSGGLRFPPYAGGQGTVGSGSVGGCSAITPPSSTGTLSAFHSALPDIASTAGGFGASAAARSTNSISSTPGILRLSGEGRRASNYMDNVPPATLCLYTHRNPIPAYVIITSATTTLASPATRDAPPSSSFSLTAASARGDDSALPAVLTPAGSSAPTLVPDPSAPDTPLATETPQQQPQNATSSGCGGASSFPVWSDGIAVEASLLLCDRLFPELGEDFGIPQCWDRPTITLQLLSLYALGGSSDSRDVSPTDEADACVQVLIRDGQLVCRVRSPASLPPGASNTATNSALECCVPMRSEDWDRFVHVAVILDSTTVTLCRAGETTTVPMPVELADCMQRTLRTAGAVTHLVVGTLPSRPRSPPAERGNDVGSSGDSGVSSETTAVYDSEVPEDKTMMLVSGVRMWGSSLLRASVKVAAELVVREQLLPYEPSGDAMCFFQFNESTGGTVRSVDGVYTGQLRGAVRWASCPFQPGCPLVLNRIDKLNVGISTGCGLSSASSSSSMSGAAFVVPRAELAAFTQALDPNGLEFFARDMMWTLTAHLSRRVVEVALEQTLSDSYSLTEPLWCRAFATPLPRRARRAMKKPSPLSSIMPIAAILHPLAVLDLNDVARQISNILRYSDDGHLSHARVQLVQALVARVLDAGKKNKPHLSCFFAETAQSLLDLMGEDAEFFTVTVPATSSAATAAAAGSGASSVASTSVVPFPLSIVNGGAGSLTLGIAGRAAEQAAVFKDRTFKNALMKYPDGQGGWPDCEMPVDAQWLYVRLVPGPRAVAAAAISLSSGTSNGPLLAFCVAARSLRPVVLRAFMGPICAALRRDAFACGRAAFLNTRLVSSLIQSGSSSSSSLTNSAASIAQGNTTPTSPGDGFRHAVPVLTSVLELWSEFPREQPYDHVPLHVVLAHVNVPLVGLLQRSDPTAAAAMTAAGNVPAPGTLVSPALGTYHAYLQSLFSLLVAAARLEGAWRQRSYAERVRARWERLVTLWNSASLVTSDSSAIDSAGRVAATLSRIASLETTPQVEAHLSPMSDAFIGSPSPPPATAITATGTASSCSTHLLSIPDASTQAPHLQQQQNPQEARAGEASSVKVLESIGLEVLLPTQLPNCPVARVNHKGNGEWAVRCDRGCVTVRTTVGFTQGRFYFEVCVPPDVNAPLGASSSSTVGSTLSIGVVTSRTHAHEVGDGIGHDGESWAFDSGRLCRLHNGHRVDLSSRARWKSGDVIGILVDLEQNRLTCLHNDRQVGVFDKFRPQLPTGMCETGGSPGKSEAMAWRACFPAVTCGTAGCGINFGAAPFVSSLPIGYLPVELKYYASPQSSRIWLVMAAVEWAHAIQEGQRRVASGSDGSMVHETQRQPDDPLLLQLEEERNSSGGLSGSRRVPFKGPASLVTVRRHIRRDCWGRSGPISVDLLCSSSRVKMSACGSEARADESGPCLVRGAVAVMCKSGKIDGSYETNNGGRWYYEVVAREDPAGLSVGWLSAEVDSGDLPPGKGLGDDEHSWALEGRRMIAKHNHHQTSLGRHVWKEGDVVGCLLDSNAKTIRFTVNGIVQREIHDADGDGTLFRNVDFGTAGLVPAVLLDAKASAALYFNRDDLLYLPDGYAPLGAAGVVNDGIMEHMLSIRMPNISSSGSSVTGVDGEKAITTTNNNNSGGGGGEAVSLAMMSKLLQYIARTVGLGPFTLGAYCLNGDLAGDMDEPSRAHACIGARSKGKEKEEEGETRHNGGGVSNVLVVNVASPLLPPSSPITVLAASSATTTNTNTPASAAAPVSTSEDNFSTACAALRMTPCQLRTCLTTLQTLSAIVEYIHPLVHAGAIPCDLEATTSTQLLFSTANTRNTTMTVRAGTRESICSVYSGLLQPDILQRTLQVLRPLTLPFMGMRILRRFLHSMGNNAAGESLRLLVNRRKALTLMSQVHEYHQRRQQHDDGGRGGDESKEESRGGALPSIQARLQASLFGQIYGLLALKEASFFSTSRKLWSVAFIGEGADDVGGPYRESISQMCSELMGPVLPLFIPSPNQEGEVGECREVFVLNPTPLYPVQLGMYEFVGRLVGACLRGAEPLSLYLPSGLWKAMVGVEPDMGDLESTDHSALQALRYVSTLVSNAIGSGDSTTMKEVNEELLSLCPGGFTVLDDAGKEHELIPEGRRIAVTIHNARGYIRMALDFKLRVMASAPRRALVSGFHQVVPLCSVAALKWYELEELVCGARDYDPDALLDAALYDKIKSDDSRVVYLREVLRGFTRRQRALFMRFVSGRERLPRGMQLRILPDDSPAAPTATVLSASRERRRSFSDPGVALLTPQPPLTGQSSNTRGRPSVPPPLTTTAGMEVQSTERERASRTTARPSRTETDAFNDERLPHASTCFYWLSLPRYSSAAALRVKLLFAIEQCMDIDADFRVHDHDVEQQPEEPAVARVNREDTSDFEDFSHLR